MKSDDLLQTIVLNFHTTVFLKEFEDCVRENPQCTVEQFREGFIEKHEILKRNKDTFPFTPYHQGVAFSLAYSFIVLPFESDEEIKQWNPQIKALQKFNTSKTPLGFVNSTYDWLKLLRHSIAHGNMKITPKLGKGHGEANFELWNYPNGKRNLPKNFICTCSYSVFQEFLDEFIKKFIKWKVPDIDIFS